MSERQSRTTAGVTIELAQNGTRDVQSFVEMGGHADGFLARGRIEDQQGLGRFDQIAQTHQFLD